MVNGHLSDAVHVKSGVPQGSVLGPLLFLVLINDIDEDIVESFLSSFADDTRVGKSVLTEEDTNVLQQDLNKIYSWAKVNNMDFNNNKFELLRYGGNTELKATIQAVRQDKCEDLPIFPSVMENVDCIGAIDHDASCTHKCGENIITSTCTRVMNEMNNIFIFMGVTEWKHR